MSDWAWKDTNVFCRPNGPHAVGEGVDSDYHNFDHVRFGSWGSYDAKFIHPNGAIETGILDMGQAALIRKCTIHTFKRIKSRFPAHFQKLIDAATPEAQAEFWANDEIYGARFVCIYGHKDFQGNNLELFDGNFSAFL